MEKKKSNSLFWKNVWKVFKYIIIPVLIAYISLKFNSTIAEMNNKQKEVEQINAKLAAEAAISQRYVELSVNILREPYSEDNEPIRKWAVELLDSCAPKGVKLTDKQRRALFNKPIYKSSGVWCNDGSYAETVEGCRLTMPGVWCADGTYAATADGCRLTKPGVWCNDGTYAATVEGCRIVKPDTVVH